MHSSQSFLKTAAQRARQFVDEPEVLAKTPDDRLMSDALVPSMVEVWSRIALGDPTLPVLSMDLDIEEGVTAYLLPPIVAQVLRLSQKDEQRAVLQDWRPNGFWAPFGQGWRIERNVIVFDPKPRANQKWTVEYVPSGDILAHYSESGGEVLTETTVKLASAPSMGMLDRRDNAYAGSVLRMIPSSGVVEERLITAYNPSTRVATLSIGLTHASVGASKAYEVVPWAWGQPVWDAVAVRAAIRIATWRRTSEGVIRQLQMELQRCMKTAYDGFNHVQMRVSKGYDRNTVDSPSAGLYGLG